MHKRLAVYVVIAAALAAVLFWQRSAMHLGNPNASAPAQKAADPKADEVPVHLPPDRRALLAVNELQRLLTGNSGASAEARFDGGHWRIFQGASEIGTLPEYPDFADLTALLARRASALHASAAVGAASPHAELERALDKFEPLAALLAADREWKAGAPDTSLHRDVARALVQLVAQTNDIVGAADVVSARALAELSLCHALGVTGLERDEALLAECMGYGAHATSMARALSPSDAIGLFVGHDDDALARRADEPDANAEARYLELSRLASNHDDASYMSWARRHYAADSTLTMPVLATMLSVGTFETQVPSAAMVLAAITDDLRLYAAPGPVAAVSKPSELGLAVRTFEQSMDAMRADADGKWLDRELMRAYYRSAFYSSMWRLAEFNRLALSSVDGTNDLASQLADMPKGPAEEFSRWYAHLAEMKSGHPAPLDLKSDLTSLPSFGSLMRFTTFDACSQTPIGRLNGVRPQARMLLGELDSRPADRLETVALMRYRIWDLVGAESLMANAARIGNPMDVDVQAPWACMSGDRAKLHALLESPGISALQASEVIRDLRDFTTDEVPTVCAAYEKSIARFPGSCRLALDYASYALEKGKPPAFSRQVLKAWIARNPGNQGLDRVAVNTSIAGTLGREHRYAEALAIAEPNAESQQFGAMNVAADLMDHCGRGAEAETLAAFALHRYPDSPDALMGLVDMFWRHQRYDDAATLLRAPTCRLDDGSWLSDVAPIFADRFSKDPDGALAAVAALEQAGFRSQGTLGSLAIELHRRAKTDLAFKIEQHVWDNGQDAIKKLVACGVFLSELQGDDAASGFIADHTAGSPDLVPGLLGIFAFAEDRPEMIWACEPKGAVDNSCQWLLRAAASLHPGPVTAKYADALRAHYAAPGTEHYYVLGRYLLGMASESDALALRVTSHAAGEVYFYIGYRAQAEHRYADAARWYERCIATGESRNAEYSWAVAQLSTWGLSEQSLATLMASDQATKARPYMSMLGLVAPPRFPGASP
jgi:hypothetical protein